MENQPIMIVGLSNIAKALGLSPEHVKNSLVGQSDFPARKYCRKWTATRQQLNDWATQKIASAPATPDELH
jgi:hypothetical protein